MRWFGTRVTEMGGSRCRGGSYRRRPQSAVGRRSPVIRSRAVNDRQQFERMLRVVIALASLGMLAIVLFPPYYATPDEAKYIGLGLNILDGRGLVTVFGVAFPNHSPIWPLAMALPQRLLGIDGLAVGHVLNAISAAVVVALTGALGWRIRPAAGVLAAV